MKCGVWGNTARLRILTFAPGASSDLKVGNWELGVGGSPTFIAGDENFFMTTASCPLPHPNDKMDLMTGFGIISVRYNFKKMRGFIVAFLQKSFYI